jgi:hypothetical protein
VALIDEIVREGARRMLAEVLQAEVDAYIAAFRDQRDEAGRRLVVRNGSHQPREVLTTAGTSRSSKVSSIARSQPSSSRIQEVPLGRNSTDQRPEPPSCGDRPREFLGANGGKIHYVVQH